MTPLASAFLVLALAAPARRVAVIVGANRAPPGRADLRFSYRDAQDMADVLVQVGEFAPADIHVLRDPEPAALLATLDQELARLSTAGESLLLFYYSGHADNGALYPAGRPLPFPSLRQRLESGAATVRIGVIDACSGGGWTGAKGLELSEPFRVDAPLELSGEGTVLISSSSGIESAHESSALLGSFFTHHLVAGLRGAAAPPGDGVVTLHQAFAYARERTVRDTAVATPQPQHPSFSMNLHGRSDLPLSRIALASTVLEVQEREGPLQLIQLSTGVVMLEVPSGRREIRLSVPPGRYVVRRQSGKGNYAREIVVENGGTASVREEDLTLSGYLVESGKGAAPSAYPLAVNDRPLALPDGVAEVTLGGGVDASPGSFAQPTWIAPEVRFGITDRATISAGAPGGICLGNSNCDRISSGLNAEFLYAVVAGDGFELAPGLRVAYDAGPQNLPVDAAIRLRFGKGGILALLATPRAGRVFPTTGAGWWYAGVDGALTLQATDRVSLDCGTTVTWKLTSSGGVAPWIVETVPITLGVTIAASPHLDFRSKLTFRNLLTHGTDPGDDRAIGAAVVWRP